MPPLTPLFDCHTPANYMTSSSPFTGNLPTPIGSMPSILGVEQVCTGIISEPSAEVLTDL